MSEGLDRSRIRAICFDLDGTLADTDNALALRLGRLLRPLAPLLPGKDPARAARAVVLRSETPANQLFALADRLGLDEAAGPLVDALHRWRGEGRPHHFLMIPGVPQALARLAAVYPLAIVSSRDERGVRAFLEQFALTAHFRCLVSAHTCRRIKPHPAPLLWAAAQMGLPPEACLMVGDTTVDIRAARAAGAQSVGVLCGFGERRELGRAGADLLLDSTPALADILLVPPPNP
jgi:phosphoglycolate phosphatase-like HAD superfamily hydrolase